MQSTATFSDDLVDPAVRGFLHTPTDSNGNGLVLTHGAGANCRSALLVALSEVFAGHGYFVLRCDLPFRQKRPTGPPFPVASERDRAGLRNAVTSLRKTAAGQIFLGGHSYGGRQATMLCAGEPDLVSGLLLLSYPLHPPRKPEQLRTQHLPDLRTPSLFVQGTRDPFGSILEMSRALALIPAKTELMEVDGAGHDLGFNGKTKALDLPEGIFAKFAEVFT
jgi:predicted alpha/beta-hydrolase family hydrolase